MLRELARLAEANGAEWRQLSSPSEDTDRAPWAVVVDLARADALPAVRQLRARWPEALLAGSLARPDRARWDEAVAGGYDLVASRGALRRQLEHALSSWRGPRAGSRISLFDTADVAGRLGLVHRLETDAGGIAVYHLGNALHAVGDRCPHAGARLSEGTLEGSVVTCPLHGSQFDVRTGERVRGPADHPLAVHRVVIESGIAFLEIDDVPHDPDAADQRAGTSKR